MKKLLFLPLLFIATMSFAQDAEEIIGKPIKIGNLLVAEYDFTEVMDCVDAIDACRSLGKGWRLPNKTELNILYKNSKKQLPKLTSMEESKLKTLAQNADRTR